ncbi:hypothetical protein CSPX01_09916 [Colletotrichum filicis]|nr:hypothetical protein CSPX01_09916 [Colletotrichum filicis]
MSRSPRTFPSFSPRTLDPSFLQSQVIERFSAMPRSSGERSQRATPARKKTTQCALGFLSLQSPAYYVPIYFVLL